MEPFDPNPPPAILRMGIVPYLNMQPLVHGIHEAFDAAGGPSVQLHAAPPSQLARLLEEGSLDLGMVPIASFFQNPQWSVLPGSMIGSRGAVRSVLLLGHGPIESWKCLRPDAQSMTSNLLAQILLRRRFGLDLTLGEPIEDDDAPADAIGAGEALVLIGSRALRWRNGFDHVEPTTVLDLGEAWTEWTGLPFVYAVWAMRPDLGAAVDLDDLARRLEELKRRNLDRLDDIVRNWPDLDHDRLTPAEATRYLSENVQYDLDESAWAGLERFRDEARRLDR